MSETNPTAADIARAIGAGPEEKPEWWHVSEYGNVCFVGPDFLTDDGACMEHVYPWLVERGIRVILTQSSAFSEAANHSPPPAARRCGE